MKMLNTRSQVIGALVALAAVAVAAGCGDDGDGGTGPDGNGGGGGAFPAQEWAGVWNIMSTTRDCAGNVIDTFSEVDTLCASEAITFEDEDGLTEIGCEGTWTATTVSLTCQDTFSEGNVSCSFNVTLNGTLASDGNSYTVTARIEVTCTTPEGTNTECTEETITATRISDSQAGCDPAGSPPWFGALSRALDSASR